MPEKAINISNSTHYHPCKSLLLFKAQHVTLLGIQKYESVKDVFLAAKKELSEILSGVFIVYNLASRTFLTSINNSPYYSAQNFLNYLQTYKNALFFFHLDFSI